jgi:hypothetical protein
MSTDDELREVLEMTAKDLSRLSTNPRTWSGWIVYLLTALEKEAFLAGPISVEEYKAMLASLQDAIRNYFRTKSF